MHRFPKLNSWWKRCRRRRSRSKRWQQLTGWLGVAAPAPACSCTLLHAPVKKLLLMLLKRQAVVLQVIAIVMDMLTDLHILQDLMDAASRRSVPVYIVLDDQGVPHFLDMCQRLQIGSLHLRVRELNGHFYKYKKIKTLNLRSSRFV